MNRLRILETLDLCSIVTSVQLRAYLEIKIQCLFKIDKYVVIYQYYQHGSFPALPAYDQHFQTASSVDLL